MTGLELQTARREFERAMKLGSASVAGLPGYCDYLTWTGDLDGARKCFDRARRNHPVSAMIGTRMARLEYFARRYAHAVELLKEVLEREPSFATARYYLALSYAFQGRTDAALHELRLARLNPHILSTDEAWIRSLSGDMRGARALLEERRKEVAAGKKKHTILLIPAISVGDRDLAIRTLEEMWKTREIELLHLKVDPRLDPLRSDVRFQHLVKKVLPL
jgi:tetratricopeptide (TPR) repeat protein